MMTGGISNSYNPYSSYAGYGSAGHNPARGNGRAAGNAGGTVKRTPLPSENSGTVKRTALLSGTDGTVKRTPLPSENNRTVKRTALLSGTDGTVKKTAQGTGGTAKSTALLPGADSTANSTTLLSGADGTVKKTARAQEAGSDNKVKAGYKSSPAECQTCKERKYQDGSNESDVSFKSPGHISPQASAATVMAHEQQHAANAHQEAAEKGGEVVSCSISLHTAVCPECGTTYVDGGTTSTSISYPDESNPYEQDKKTQDGIKMRGANVDYAA